MTTSIYSHCDISTSRNFPVWCSQSHLTICKCIIFSDWCITKNRVVLHPSSVCYSKYGLNILRKCCKSNRLSARNLHRTQIKQIDYNTLTDLFAVLCDRQFYDLLAASRYATLLSQTSGSDTLAASCYATLLSDTSGSQRPVVAASPHASCTQYAVKTNSDNRRWGPVSAAAKITAVTSADRCPHQNVGQPKEFSGRVTVSV